MTKLVTATSKSAGLSVRYILIGLIMVVWSGIWFWAMSRAPEGQGSPDWQKYICTGVMLTGIVFAVVGLFYGPLGSAAQLADKPVAVADKDVPATDPNAMHPPGTQP